MKSKPFVAPAESLSGKDYSASQDADRLPEAKPYPDNAVAPLDLAVLGEAPLPGDTSVPQAGVSAAESVVQRGYQDPDALDRSKYTTDFGSPNGKPMLRSSDKPTTLAEEASVVDSDETPEDLRVLRTHGQGFTVVDGDKDKAKRVKLGATFLVIRKGCERDSSGKPRLTDGRAVEVGVPVAICRVAGAFNASEATFGWQAVPGVLMTPEASHFAGIQAGDTLRFLARDADLANIGRNPFEGSAP